MNWIRFDLEHWSSIGIRKLSAVELGTLIRLYVHCATNMTGGRVIGLRSASRHTLRSLWSASRPVVDRLVVSLQADWDGDDLVIKGYDVEAENSYKKSRILRKNASLTRWNSEQFSNAPNLCKTDAKPVDDPMQNRCKTFLSDLSGSVRDPARHTDQGSVRTPFQNGFPLGEGKTFSISELVGRVCEAWPWPETNSPERIRRALRFVGPENIDRIVRAMKRDTLKPKWRAMNPTATAATYIRNGQWKLEPKPAAPKNGANGSNGKTVLRSLPNHSESEAQKTAALNELVRDFTEAFPKEPFPGKEKAWKMLKTVSVKKLALLKS